MTSGSESARRAEILRKRCKNLRPFQNSVIIALQEDRSLVTRTSRCTEGYRTGSHFQWRPECSAWLMELLQLRVQVRLLSPPHEAHTYTFHILPCCPHHGSPPGPHACHRVEGGGQLDRTGPGAGWALVSRWPVPSRLLTCKPFHRKKGPGGCPACRDRLDPLRSTIHGSPPGPHQSLHTPCYRNGLLEPRMMPVLRWLRNNAARGGPSKIFSGCAYVMMLQGTNEGKHLGPEVNRWWSPAQPRTKAHRLWRLQDNTCISCSAPFHRPAPL